MNTQPLRPPVRYHLTGGPLEFALHYALTLAALSLRFARVNRATFHPDGERPESDADHSVMLVLLALHIASRHLELNLDVGRLAALGVVHDLPEVYAGDTDTTGGLSFDEQAAKTGREADALERLRYEIGGGSWITLLISSYERQRSPESRFLRYLDKVLPKLTAALNGNAATRRAGRTLEWLRERHLEQGAELRTQYPEFAHVLGPLFDEACALSEAALVAP